MVERYRVYEAFSGKEDLLDEDKFKQYMAQPAWLLNGQKVLTEEREVQAIIQQMQEQFQMQIQQWDISRPSVYLHSVFFFEKKA